MEKEKKTCDHCEECRGGSCCAMCDQSSGSCDHCQQCASGTCCSECGADSMACRAGMCGSTNSWKWYFVIGIIALILGLLVGNNIGRNRMRHVMAGNIPHDMQSMMQAMHSEIADRAGDDLDKAFLEQMIVHHEGAIDMAQILKDGTKRPELQELADDIIVAQSKEVGMMEVWLKEWFK